MATMVKQVAIELFIEFSKSLTSEMASTLTHRFLCIIWLQLIFFAILPGKFDSKCWTNYDFYF